MALIAFLIGVGGAASELLLLGHTESWQQWIPLAALVAGLLALGYTARLPGPRSLRAFRWIMMAWIAIGALGVYFHTLGNLEFEMERQQALSGLALAWSTMTGATPILSPGAMVLLAMFGLIYLRGSK